MAGGGRPIRLDAGTCALPTAEGIWLGVLRGDIDDGWRTAVGLLPLGDLRAVADVLRRGGSVRGPDVVLRGDGIAAVAEVRGQGTARLAGRASARLQVLASALQRGRTPPAPPSPTAPLPVTPARAALSVDGVSQVEAGSVVVGVDARAVGAVDIALRDLDGVVASLTLPALPLLLAAAEARCDGADVALRLRTSDADHRPVTVLEGALPAGAAMGAAAQAQWLFPTVVRRAAAA